jgi:high-affinity K+ transport system ATPase subunit B
MSGGRRNTDDLLAAALAGGETVANAATLAGVSKRTAERRVADLRFRQHVGEVRAQRMASALAKAEAVLVKAVEKLDGLLDSLNEPIRLGAAKAAPGLVESLTRLTELADLARRVAELEATRRESGGTSSVGSTS